jgi:hypothetical protein
VGADGATHPTNLTLSADRQSLVYRVAPPPCMAADRVLSGGGGTVGLPLRRLAAVVDLAPPADGLKGLRAGVAALSEERRAAVAQVVSRHHPAAAKQALLLCFLEDEGGSSSDSSAITAAEMLAANPAYAGERPNL